MEYPCKTIAIFHLPVVAKGIMESLCDKCHCADCTNPIQFTEVSVMGITKKCRCYMLGTTNPRFVVECRGFQPEIIDQDSEESLVT